MFSLNQSSLYRQGTSAQTETVISSRFKIYSPAVGEGKYVKLGVTSAFQQSESKNIEVVRGLGYGDQVAELVPAVTEPNRIQVTRTMLYLANIMQVFGYKAGVSGGVRSLKHHKWPFDIMTEILFSIPANQDGGIDEATIAAIPPEGGLNNLGNPGLHCIVTVYEGCWMSEHGVDYGTETSAVAENCTIICTDVMDITGTVYGEFIDSGNAPGDVTGASSIFGESNNNLGQ